MSPPPPADARTPEREIRVGRVPPQRHLGHEVAPSSGGKGEAADRGPRPSRKHRGPPRVLAELHSVSCPHWLRSDGTRGKGKDAEAARRTAAALASHPPLECTRRKKHIQLRSKSDVEPLLLSTGIVHVIPDPPHTAWPLLMGWKHSAKLVICTCRSGGPSGPKNKTKKAAEEQPRPTHSPPHTRVSVCTNATFCFVRSIDKSNFGV